MDKGFEKRAEVRRQTMTVSIRSLEEADGNVSRAAELMGVDRSHLYRRMRALGIQTRGERTLT